MSEWLLNLTPVLLHLWKSRDIWTAQKWLLHMSHPAPSARALDLLHSDTEQSKNLFAIVIVWIGTVCYFV